MFYGASTSIRCHFKSNPLFLLPYFRCSDMQMQMQGTVGLTLFSSLQHFLESLSNNTGYPVEKLLGRKLWLVYDALNCQVGLHSPARTHTHTYTYTETFQYLHAAACKCLITDSDSCCSRGGGGFAPTHLQQSHGPSRVLCGTIRFFFHTHSRDMNRQHIEMIIKALWDGWILGQVECAHSHLQNEHLLSSDRC